MKITTRVETKGRFFRPGSAEKIREASEAALEELMSIGHGMLLERLRVKPSGVLNSVQEALSKGNDPSRGTYRASISTTPVQHLTGTITDGGKLRYGPWLEGVSNRNKTTSFPGYFSFTVVRQELEKKSKPLFEKFMARYARKMNN